MSEQMITVEVLRYRPEQDNEPFWQSYEIPYNPSMSILEALTYIKDHLDGTLSYRWSCRMAVCGSCGMMVGGVPKLGCKSFLRDYYPNPVRLEPLANFPIERDLVVDISDFIDKLEKIKPYIISKEERALSEGESLQTPHQLKRYKQFTMCINCGLCYAACPQYALKKAFTGPAALALLMRYNLDSRDEGYDQRIPIMNLDEGAWGCTLVGYCSEVCPKDVDPAAAINQGKVLSTIDYAKHLIPTKEVTHEPA